MKAALIGVAALCAQAVAIPHGDNHRKLHEKRAGATITHSIVTTKWVTYYAPDVVIWLDEDGNVLETEYRWSSSTTTLGVTGSSKTVPTAHTNIVSVSSDPTTSSAAVVTTPSATSIVAPPPPVESSSSNEQAPTSAAPTSSVVPVQSSGSDAKVVDNDAASGGSSGYGICYDLIDSTSNCKSANTMNSEFDLLAKKGYTMVRFYDIGCDLGVANSKAAANGLKVFAGLNGINNLQPDVQKLINMLKDGWNNVDTINIGNEVVNSGQASASEVAAAVNAARPLLVAAGFKGSVVTVDTFNKHAAFPALCEASDYCAANAHAFFDTQTTASDAGTWVNKAYQDVAKISNGKRVVITESGWPSGGSSNGAAIPGSNQQSQAIASIKAAFSDKPGNLMLFQAYNAGYKSPGFLGVEQFFGIYDQ